MALEVQDNLTPFMTMVESATDGSEMGGNPPADHRKLFVGEDGLLYLMDSAGTVTSPSGGSISDILDIPTAETDDTLVLAPDGAGGVEFRAEAGGGGGGALVLLEQHTASSSASLAYTAFISSTYDTYRFELLGMVPATDNVGLFMHMGTGGGPTYDTSGVYASGGFRWSNTGSAAAGSGSGTAFGIDASGGIDNGASIGLCGHIMLYQPQSTSPAPRVSWQVSYTDNAGSPLGTVGSGQYNGGSAVTAVRFTFSSGNISVGTIRVYGVAK